MTNRKSEVDWEYCNMRATIFQSLEEGLEV